MINSHLCVCVCVLILIIYVCLRETNRESFPSYFSPHVLRLIHEKKNPISWSIFKLIIMHCHISGLLTQSELKEVAVLSIPRGYLSIRE